VQFGTDAIIGMIPFVGDLITSLTGLYIIHQARQLGATQWTVTRMLINWGIDTAIGAIPVVGDIFDIAFKSNTKNVKLLIADLERRAVELREMNREQRLAAAA